MLDARTALTSLSIVAAVLAAVFVLLALVRLREVTDKTFRISLLVGAVWVFVHPVLIPLTKPLTVISDTVAFVALFGGLIVGFWVCIWWARESHSAAGKRVIAALICVIAFWVSLILAQNVLRK